MSRPSDPVDTALESLRIHGTFHRDSFMQDVENQIMQVDQQASAHRGRLIKVLVATAVVFGGSLAGYAAVEGWSWWEGITFVIDDDGHVTDGNGEASGEEVQNEDGSFSTRFDFGNGTGIMTTTDEPLDGMSIYVGPTLHSEGKFMIRIDSDEQN